MIEDKKIWEICEYCKYAKCMNKNNSELLFFILIFLLLFYDKRPTGCPVRTYLGCFKSCPENCPYLQIQFNFEESEYGAKDDSRLLFFILIFLVLFYK